MKVLFLRLTPFIISDYGSMCGAFCTSGPRSIMRADLLSHAANVPC